MMTSMKGATQLLGSMNRTMNLPALNKIAMDFQRENELMDMRQEAMDDAIDEVTGLDDEEESEDIVNQVLDEIGVNLGQSLGETPTGLHTESANQGKVAEAVGGGNPADDDLQARLNDLRR
jgi:charged multivesicular body protein 2A